jgi:hypothetical protein
LPSMRVHDKYNNQLVGWVRAQRLGNRVHRRPDREEKLKRLGVRWKSRKGKADLLPYLSTHLSVKKPPARHPEDACKRPEADNVSDAPVHSLHNSRGRIIGLCQDVDILSSTQRGSATARRPPETSIVIDEKLDFSVGGEIGKESRPTVFKSTKNASTMVSGNVANNSVNGDTKSEDCTLQRKHKRISSHKFMDADLEAFPAVQRHLVITNNGRKRERLQKCQAPINLHGLTEDLVNVTFPTGSVVSRVMAKLEAKKRNANSTGRFRRNCGL